MSSASISMLLVPVISRTVAKNLTVTVAKEFDPDTWKPPRILMVAYWTSVGMREYYSRRAEEYEEVYHRDDSAAQRELQTIRHSLTTTLQGRRILEVACGTGYWTRSLSESAKWILATDVSSEMLAIARTKEYGCPLTFAIADAYSLPFKSRSFDAALANFWFSHIPRSLVHGFLSQLHRLLLPHSRVFIADNNFVPGLGGDLKVIDGSDDTFKSRILQDGSQHLILKNYYTTSQLVEIFRSVVPSFGLPNVFYGSRYWYVSYHVDEPAEHH